ncbi:MAG: GGDEF domain-containing protein [Ignavibacteria bacterium]|nr:GGDEF domain-containing protein [Ignavibacteria bacterium]
MAVISKKAEECLSFASEILRVLKSTNQYEQVLHHIVDRVVRMYRCRTCAIVIVDPQTEYLNIALGYGLSHTYSKAFRRKLATGALGRLLWTGAPILIADSEAEAQLAEEVKLEYPFGSAVCVQMSADHRTIGYLHADCSEKRAFSPEDVRVLQTFADFAALAIHKSELFEANLRLDRTDHETDLEKYAPFLERIRTSIERAQTLNEKFGLMVLDIDNFKHISSMYGYESSRKMLKEIGGLIKSRLRNIDAAGRHALDEFIVLRANSDLDESLLFADQLRSAVEQTVFTNHEIKTTVSVGIAVYPHHAATMDELLNAVKHAVYEAQRSGRNRITCFGE